MRFIPLISLALSSVLLTGAACFNFGDRPPPPVATSSIAGTIDVSGVSGQLAVDPNTVRQERVDVAVAMDGPLAHTGAPMPMPISRPDPSRDAGERHVKSSLPLEWKAGDVLVLFERGRYDRTTLAPVMRAMIDRAGLTGVTARVVRCTAATYCKVVLRKDGRKLDVAATDRAQRALDKEKRDGVRVVAKNLKKWGFFTPNDPLLTFQWHYDFIHMKAAWDIAQGDDSIITAIVDSGAVTAHPDLTDRWARDSQNRIIGTDMVEADSDNDDESGRDTNPEDPGDNLFGAGNSSWHGTHIAGTIGASTNNGQGTAGITIKGKMVPVRVLGAQLSGFDADIMDGIFWAIGQHVDGSPDNQAPARVINLSLGGPTDTASQQFWDANLAQVIADPTKPILIAAAGNSDEDAGGIVPANVLGMIVVGAVNISGTRASYSNFGSVIDIMAPGGDEGTDLNADGQPDAVLSTVNPDFDWRDGTSMACPHVAGVASLVLSQNPTLDQQGMETLLKASADTHGRCNEGCGSGWLDAVQTLLNAGGEIQQNPALAVDVTQVFFPEGFQSKDVQVLNLGNAPFAFSTTIDGPQASLFTVTPATGSVLDATTSNNRTPLTITLARGGLLAGSGVLHVATTDQTPQQIVDVTLDFNDNPNHTPTHLEQVQVGAFKKGTGGNLIAVAQAVATRDNGFKYEIPGLRAGDYYIYAIGDDNEDGQFQADVESFGAYPSRDLPTSVHVDGKGKATGVDFAIDAAFITGIVGGIGAPCNDKQDCTFLADADCITTFSGGYCSRICDDNQCGDAGACESVQCSDDAGNPADCNVCFSRCASDDQCRADEGYTCDRGECVPLGF